MGLAFRLLQVAMFCKIFNMRPIGYVITSLLFIVVFIWLCWLIDKTSFRKRVEGESGRRSEPTIEILGKLNEIQKQLNRKGV